MKYAYNILVRITLLFFVISTYSSFIFKPTDILVDSNSNEKNPSSLLFELILKGEFEQAEELIYHGAEVNVRDIQGNTPLHSALMTSNQSLVLTFSCAYFAAQGCSDKCR